MCFPDDNSKSFRVVTIKLGTDTCLGSGKIPIDFTEAICNYGLIECDKNSTSVTTSSLVLITHPSPAPPCIAPVFESR